MTLIPITTGRIPNSLIASQAANNVNAVEDQLNQVEQEIETGQQLVTPGQNPTATAIVLPLQQQLAAQTQYSANLTTDQSFLQNTDTALQTVSTGVSQANSLLLSGLEPPRARRPTTRLLPEQVSTIIQSLVNTANTTFDGQYLFGGSDTQTAPFQQLANGSVLYNGNQASINSNIASGLDCAQQH